MGLSDLLGHQDRLININDDGYVKELSFLLEDPDMEVFEDVIRYMVEHRVRMEEENLV